MAQSQNGYSANVEEMTRVYDIPGTDRYIKLRKGPTGLMLVHLATWFDRKIEILDQGIWDEWGYAERPIRGATELSNHASGTAMDLNATKHPMEVRGTFTKRQELEIRKRLGLYGGCIRWGGDYSGRPDEMHFEINKNFWAVKKRWDLLKWTPIGIAVRQANRD